jgi:hypothetical protein
VVLATVIDYLDAHSGAFTALLTAVLIVVTIYYAIQNHRLVEEAKRAREAAIRPQLAVDFHRLGPTAMTVAVRNVGPGTAFAIDVRLRFVPIKSEEQIHEQRARHNLLGSGQQRDFFPPGALDNNLNVLPQKYKSIALVGIVHDADGTSHHVNDTIEDLAEWREVLREAPERWIEPDPERRAAVAFSKVIEAPARSVVRSLEGVARAIRETREPEPETEDD